MPIRPYLAGRHFDPETIELMGVALTKVSLALQITDFESRKAAANTIIALVADGKTDPDQIAAQAIDQIRGTKSATG